MKVSYQNNPASDKKLVYFQFQPENTLQEICNKITEDTATSAYALLFQFDGYNLKIVAVNKSDYSNVTFEFVFMENTRATVNVLW